MEKAKSRNQDMKLYEGWLDHKSTNETKWKKLWCVLKGRVLYFFSSNQTVEHQHVGTLSVTVDAKFKNGEGSQKKGWKFDLYTGMRLNKFKTKMFSERELWKAYIVGICSGDTPDDIDLPPAQKDEVQKRLQRCLQQMQLPPLPQPTRPDSPVSRHSGFDSPSGSADGVFTMQEDSVSNYSDGGPTVRHKFWLDQSKTDKPSWFFEGITRQDAEKILSLCGNHGNTLMRESVTFRSTGSYVISKRMQHARVDFNHFEVTRIAEGFRINVENAHKPMRCLSEVMDFFVTMSGEQWTRPMTTNNPKDLGLNEPDYQTRIFRTTHDDESGEELEEDYEEPTDIQTSNSKTWSQAKTNKATEMGKQQHSKTMMGHHEKRPMIHQELMNRFSEAKAVVDLDNTLKMYDEDTQSQAVSDNTYSYENESVIKSLRDLDTAPPPPGPPPACVGRPAFGSSYVNDNALDVRTRRQSVTFAADVNPDKKASDQRQRTKSVPNIFPPGCQFNVSVPASSQLPAPGIIPPIHEQGPSVPDIPLTSPVNVLKSQFEKQSTPQPSNPKSVQQLQQQRRGNHKTPPPVLRKSSSDLRPLHNTNSFSSRPKTFGSGNEPVGGSTNTYQFTSEDEYYDDASAANIPVSFSLPDSRSSAGTTQNNSEGVDTSSLMNRAGNAGEMKGIKARLENILIQGPKKPSSQQAPPPEDDADQEYYEDITNYVNVDSIQ